MLPCLFLAVTIIAAEQLQSFCRKIRRRYHWYYKVIGCFLWSRTKKNYISILSAYYVCLRGMQVSQSGPARTHRRRRPPSCMIVTVMIVTVSPQCMTLGLLTVRLNNLSLNRMFLWAYELGWWHCFKQGKYEIMQLTQIHIVLNLPVR